MSTLTLEPVDQLTGTLRLPGSKSISNRALLLAALAAGECRVDNLLDSDDTEVMLTALKQLGVAIRGELGPDNPTGTLIVRGQGGPLVTAAERSESLFMGLAGTAIRPLCAALTLGAGRFVLDGTPRMRERPIGHLVDALRALGAQITYDAENGYPPLTVQAHGLAGGRTHIDGSISSQFLSALLLAAPYAATPVTVEVQGELVSKPYVRITLDMMRRFGIQVHASDDLQRFDVPQGVYQAPAEFLVEGDASSATYFLAAGAIRGNGIRVEGVGADSIQGDKAFVDVLAQMGARVRWEAQAVEVAPGHLHGIDADMNHIPDAAMTVAVLALFADGPTHLRNIYNWRVKETDRLAAMATELRKTGAKVTEFDDALRIEPPQRLDSARIDTYGDHRMAMCFSLAALGGVAIQINDPECVAKTFPTYFEEFKRLAVSPA